MKGMLISRSAVVALLMLVQAASGQQELKAVEEKVGDLGPLSRSLRVLGADLRQPANFDRVYRISGTDDRFIRINGGLYAVFERSLYVPSEDGLVPLIPGGTVFYIGRPSFLRDVEQPASQEKIGLLDKRSHSNRLDTRNLGVRSEATFSDATFEPLLHRSSGRDTDAGTSDHEVAATINNDPDYRAARIRQLMKKTVKRMTALDG